jgi:hypothetical protein
MARRFVAIIALGLAFGTGMALGTMLRHDVAATDSQDEDSASASTAVFYPPDMDDFASAERNLFPAPQSALWLADDLALNAEQRRELHNLQHATDSEITAIARRLNREERRLDRAFADDNIDVGRIDALTSRIGALQARMRATRLRAHLTTRQLLTPEQLLRYAELRGFQPAQIDDAVDELDLETGR